MTGRSYCHIKELILSLLVYVGFSSLLFAQSRINGVINQYGNVTSLGTDYVIVDDATQFSQFSAEDTVLLIQMKGVRISVIDDNSYGTPENIYGKPGKHEFLIIQSLEPGTRTIIFRNNIVNTFSTEGILQIVKVPSFNSAVVDGSDLICAPWDSTSKTGGVLALIVGRTLSLNSNINVTNKGFTGGAISIGTGLCIGSDPAMLDNYAYNSGFSNSGFKGESPASRGYLADLNYPPIYPGFSKGKGANLTAGGGGNGRFSGGGGGSNYGAGGKGGLENSDCSPTYLRKDGGGGGLKLKNILQLDGGLFLGAGGGSSTYLSGSVPSPGANGGGIIIIICDTIKGNGKSIIANGGFPALTASLNAGAGGGGGGGSVAIYLQSFSSSLLTISANGGKGGNNAGNYGEGGGGGGGFINTHDIPIPANVTRTVTGGAVGTRLGTSTGGSGSDGEKISTFLPVLNGFLFNSIRSSVTGDQVDSICSNVIPKEITGTEPVGGSGNYTYLWQKSYDVPGPVTDIPSSNSMNYLPSAPESDTVWFRRIVKDDVSLLTDTSKWVKIIVQPAITGNFVGKDTTICYGQNPLSLVPLNDGPENGNGNYAYTWIQNNTNTNWETSPAADGTNVDPDYDPPALIDTTYYQRIVTSGRCIDYSSTVIVAVLPSITGNIMVRPDSVICEGSLFTDLDATDAGGGNLSYKYQWQDSITSSVNYLPAIGTNTGTTYTPDTSTFSVIEQRYFRRVVFSGPDSVCQSRSLPVLLTRYHKIANNTISADQTIGWDSIPAPFIGSDPLDGDLSYGYDYKWESMIYNQPWAPAVVAPYTLRDYSPVNLIDTTWYRRIVNSSVCADTSNLIVVNVHDLIIKNTISFVSGAFEDTICTGSVPAILYGALPEGGTAIPGDYAYKWFISLTGDPLQSEWSEIAGSTGQNYQPVALTQTTFFRREVASPAVLPAAVSISNNITITVLPLISNSITGIDFVCYGTQPLLPFGESHSGGDNSYSFTWQDSTNTTGWNNIAGYIYTTSATYQPPNLITESKYRRIVYSGSNDCCIDTSYALNIGIHPLPTGTLTSTVDTTICEGSEVSLRISLTGASKWNVVYNEIYNENTSPVTVNDITGPNINLLVSPVTGTALTTYIYSLASVQDKNGCIATSLTGTRKVDVNKVPTAFAGADATVCGSTVTLNAIPSVGTGTWYYPAEVVASTADSSSVTVTIDSATFADGTVSYQFYWEEANWQCKRKDTVEITFDKRINSINAGPDTALYSFDNIIYMVADPVLTWETGQWTVVSGTGDFADDADNKTKISNLSKGLNTFLWTIINGECKNEDKVNIEVYDLIIPEGFSPNNDSYNNTFIITGLDLPNQVAELKIVNGAGAEVFSTSNRDGQEFKEWDGKNSNGADLAEGTYYYLLKITSNGNGQVFKKSGFIVLKRY